MTASPTKQLLPIANRPLVVTPAISEIVERAMTYLRTGLAVHLSGPAGTGKTTIALHLANLLERPAVFIEGDDQLTSTELVRGGASLHRHRVVDNYIRSVVRTDERLTESWAENWLTTACEKGYTLIYDEFTRSRPEANTVLLSVLEERVLVSTGIKEELHILPVHPEFRAIFTSNPTEYVAVHKSPDALRDRMVTIMLEPLDAETETAIVKAHSHLPDEDCRRIIRLVGAIRSGGKGTNPPSLRTAVNLAKILAQAKLAADFSHRDVMRYCRDVFAPPAVASPAVLADILSGFAPKSPSGRETTHGSQAPRN